MSSRNDFRMTALASLALFFGILSSCSNGDDAPQPEGGDDLLSVSALDESHVWAVGHSEIILFGTK